MGTNPRSGGKMKCHRKRCVLARAHNTVDVAAATYENSIGSARLSGFWQDPDFDPSNSAFYDARVLEIPTPRWSTYDAARLGRDAPDDVPASIQERAWSSPIWYTPESAQEK